MCSFKQLDGHVLIRRTGRMAAALVRTQHKSKIISAYRPSRTHRCEHTQANDPRSAGFQSCLRVTNRVEKERGDQMR